MRSLFALTLAVSLLALTPTHTSAAYAPQVQSPVVVEQDKLEPDRPDVTNGTHIVDVGLLQMEAGGVWNRARAGGHSSSTPTTVRLGLTAWLEARGYRVCVLSAADVERDVAGELERLAGV